MLIEPNSHSFLEILGTLAARLVDLAHHSNDNVEPLSSFRFFYVVLGSLDALQRNSFAGSRHVREDAVLNWIVLQAVRRIVATVRTFRTKVQNALPTECSIEKTPNLFQMLSSMDLESLYAHYRVGCQYSHGTAFATTLYGKHLGSEQVVGEYTNLGDWHWVLSIVSKTFIFAGEHFLHRNNGDVALFTPKNSKNRLSKTIDSITHEE